MKPNRRDQPPASGPARLAGKVRLGMMVAAMLLCPGMLLALGLRGVQDLNEMSMMFAAGVYILPLILMQDLGLYVGIVVCLCVSGLGALILLLEAPLFFGWFFPACFYWAWTSRLHVTDLAPQIGNVCAFFLVSWALVGSPFVGTMLLPMFLYLSFPPEHRLWRGALTREPVRVQGQKRVFMSDAVTRITRRDPAFREDQFLKRAEAVFHAITQAWNDGDLQGILPLVSDGIYEQLHLSRQEIEALGVKQEFHELGIFDARIAQMHSDSHFDTIHVYFHARRKERWLRSGEKKPLTESDFEEFTEYWSFSRRPSTRTLKKKGVLEGCCPNCSAPLQHGRAAICPVCQCFIRSGAYDWVLTGIAQASEWAVQEPEEIPGAALLQAREKVFSLSELVDRSAAMFWRKQTAERRGTIDPLVRFSSAIFQEEYAAALQEDVRRVGFRPGLSRLDSVRVAGIDAGEQTTRVFVRVTWTYCPMQKNSSDPRSWNLETEELHQEVFVLARNAGVPFNANAILTSSHCPNCGAPEKETFTSVCEYCNTVLNDTNRNWVLQKITDPHDAECLQFKTTVTKQVKNLPEVFTYPDSQIDLLAVLIQVMLSDAQIDPREMTQLQEFANARGIAPAKFQAVLKAIREGWVQIPNPTCREESLEILRMGIRMALVDNEISEEEHQTLNILAHHLGFSASDVKLMVARERKSFFARQSLCEPDLNEDTLRAMVAVMGADGKIADEEMQLLMSLAEERRFPRERLLPIMEQTTFQPELFRPLEKDAAMAVLRNAARMALIDGTASAEEIKVLEAIGARLGYSSGDIRMILTREIRFLREQRKTRLTPPVETP